MATQNQQDQETPHEVRIRNLVSNIRAYLKDNLSVVGAAHPGDIRTVDEIKRSLKHATEEEIREALTVLTQRNEIRMAEGSANEFVIVG